jgi:hypothetical protein
VARIADLTAAQVARHASNTFIFWGRQETGTRLAYHALVLDPKQPEGLARLSDFLDIAPGQAFAAAVLEYACAQETGLPREALPTLQDLRFHALWSWGFYRHRSGRTELAWEDFDDRSQFTFDEGRYQAFVGPVIGRAGSLTNAFRSAHTLGGVLAGLLTHRAHGARAPFEELFYPDNFGPTPGYAQWLSSSADQLDRLEEERARRPGGGGAGRGL